MTYQQFKNRWLGKRVDIDRVYGYQCVDLIKQYMFETAGIKNGAYGNAIDYWVKTHSVVRNKYNRIAGSDAIQGDIVILKGVNGNPYGHIGICENKNIVSIQILEQNGSSGNGSGVGRDSIRLRWIPRWRVAGLLRLKVDATYYVVKRGDTLSKIATRYGISWRDIYNNNKSIIGSNPSLIYPGQKLRIK